MSTSAEQMCNDIMRLLHFVKATALTVAEEQDVTRAQWFALMTIYRQGELSMRQVAAALHCDASNITGIVDRLMAQGLVVRQESSQDRRAKTLRLTQKGLAITESLQASMPERLGCKKLTPQEGKVLHEIVQKLCG